MCCSASDVDERISQSTIPGNCVVGSRRTVLSAIQGIRNTDGPIWNARSRTLRAFVVQVWTDCIDKGQAILKTTDSFRVELTLKHGWTCPNVRTPILCHVPVTLDFICKLVVVVNVYTPYAKAVACGLHSIP